MNLDEQSEFAHAYGKLYTENAALVGERDGARALLKDNRAEVARLTDALAERRTERNALRAELKDAERLRLQVEEFRVYAKNGWAKVEQLISKVEQVQRELKQEQEAYETLTALLRKRFPRNADGSLPDFKIEDVLRENERLRPVVEAAGLEPMKPIELKALEARHGQHGRADYDVMDAFAALRIAVAALRFIESDNRFSAAGIDATKALARIAERVKA
jgi:chromosome segregation ATPase